MDRVNSAGVREEGFEPTDDSVALKQEVGGGRIGDKSSHLHNGTSS